MTKQSDLQSKNIKKLFLKLLPAQIFVIIASSLASIVNGMLVGNKMSSECMVALGFVVPLTALIAAVAQIVSGGSGILVGLHMGSGKIKEINRTFTVSVIVSLITGIALGVLCFVLANPLAYIFGARNESVVLTTSYIRALSIGFVGQILASTLMTYLSMCNKSGVSLFLTVFMAGINLLLGVVSIETMPGNIFFIGLATSLSQLLTAGVALIYLMINRSLVWFEKNSFSFDKALEIFKLGLPAALASILYAIRNVFMNTAALNVGGTVAVNALAIWSSCCGIFDAFNIGVGSAVLMVASIYVGEKDRQSILHLSKVAIKIGMIMAFVKVAILVIFGKDIAVLFGAEGEAINETAALLRFHGYSMPLNIITIVIVRVYQALSKTKLCNINYLINCIIVPVICCFIIGPMVGTKGIYILFALAEVVSFIYLYIAMNKEKPIRDFNQMLCPENSFKEVESLSLSIIDEDGVTNVSKMTIEYLNHMNIDSRRAKMTGLCAEEMCSNIVEHGFNKDKKSHVIDVYLAVIEDEIFLRIKDDCIPFDPRSRLSVVEPKDPCKNIGIRMVNKIAKEIKYQVYFGMNILTIKM